MARNYIQGKFYPLHPQKYRGDVNNIIFRSGWEKRFFHWCDTNSNIVEWASEEIIVPYLCQTDNRMHRYFVDAYIKVKDINGNIESFLVEIKPFNQTQPPKFPGRQTQKYLTEVETFIKNQSKWKAADRYAKDRGAKFVVITEKELGIGKK